ncbi:MAG: hypothetical protein KC492_03770 [Myxococcales bacterium]|nr:hypothetical protein [Myxococcales bacterium]
MVAHLPDESADSSAKRELPQTLLERWLFRGRQGLRTQSGSEMTIAYQTERVSESASKFAFTKTSALVVISSGEAPQLEVD